MNLSLRRIAFVAGAFFVVVVAAVPRIQCLGCQSLWLDEVLTAEAGRRSTAGGALAVAASWIDQSPLPYLLTWALRGLGPDEFAIRLPYAIGGVLAVLAMYVLATSLFGRLAGVLGGVLMAVLPYAVYYSQEARSYILLILLTTVLMHVAYRAAGRQHAVDWFLLAVVGSLSLYVGYLAVATLAAAYAYIAVVVLADGFRRAREPADRPAIRSLGPPLAGATISALVTVASFLPWAPNFVAFLGRRDLGFGRVTTDGPATLDQVVGVLGQLDLHGLGLALFVAGMVTALVMLTTGRWRAALIPLLFLFIPLAGFLLLAGDGIVQIWPRYFSILYPPIVLLMGLGIVGLAETSALAWRRVRRSGIEGRKALVARSLVAIPLAIALAASSLAAVQAAQRTPKGSDYRGAVDRMLLADPVHPVVVVIGPNAAWVERGLVYYAWARGSDLRVIDGLDIDLVSMADLRASTSLWLATRQMDLPSGQVPAATARSDHTDFALFDIDIAAGGGLAAARDILASVAGSEPGMARSARLIDTLDGDHAAGEELLPAPAISTPQSGPPAAERWTLQKGVTVAPDGSGFVASPVGGEVNAILATGRLTPGDDYLLQFGCRTDDLRGELRAWVIATDVAGAKVYLDGSGDRCRSVPGSGRSAIAFTVPAGIDVVTIWLQVTGSGNATIGPVSLRQF
jgi:4-amino-4-deoxy-L-arabinose transferase-like glycosyltransferase